MTGAEIPTHVQEFIVKYIATVEQLELLLFMYRNAGQAWNADALARELRIGTDAAAAALGHFHGQGLLVGNQDQPGAYRFQPAGGGTDLVVGELSRVYLERRVAVITLLYSKPSDRLRSFSDAFKFRKDE